jgi:hypothetical protein
VCGQQTRGAGVADRHQLASGWLAAFSIVIGCAPA